MKVEREINGAVAKPYLGLVCKQNLKVTVSNDKNGYYLTIYDGEKMFTIPLKDIEDILKVSKLKRVAFRRVADQEEPTDEIKNEPICILRREPW